MLPPLPPTVTLKPCLPALSTSALACLLRRTRTTVLVISAIEKGAVPITTVRTRLTMRRLPWW